MILKFSEFDDYYNAVDPPAPKLKLRLSDEKILPNLKRSSKVLFSRIVIYTQWKPMPKLHHPTKVNLTTKEGGFHPSTATNSLI